MDSVARRQQENCKNPNQKTTARPGDKFKITVKENGVLVDLIACAEKVISSSEAKQLGVVKRTSKRTGIVVGLRVPGKVGPFQGLFWKWRSQIKPYKE